MEGSMTEKEEKAIAQGMAHIKGGVVVYKTTGCPVDVPLIQDSGERRHFATGSVRDTNTDKGRMDLLADTGNALMRVARHFQNGAAKYEERNWLKGQDLATYYDSANRHAIKAWLGHDDEDHWAAWAWNVLCMIETMERIQQGKLPKELWNLPNEKIKNV
jgi:hypothetical protein